MASKPSRAVLGRVGMLAAATLWLAFAAAAQPHKSVIELFTSQGCASCPPADALLDTLSKERDLLALSFPVDTWDYTGWKDTLASPIFALRQKSYSRARGDGQVYTPQVVVNGLTHAVGSDVDDIRRAIEAAHRRAEPFSVPLTLDRVGDRVRIHVGAALRIPDGTADVWLLRIVKTKAVPVGRGDNAGRTLTYTNVVRSMRRIGEWSGAPATFDVETDASEAPDSDGFVVLLQAGTAGRPGAILAAAVSDDTL